MATNRDVWLVLGSGTTVHLAAGGKHGTSGDDARAYDQRTRTALDEKARVDVVEAMLINYFKPDLNVQHVKKLNLRAKALAQCRAAHVSGLMLAFTPDDLRVSMFTDAVSPRMMHVMKVCL